MFDFSKVDDFEKHIELSIPNYKGLCDIFRSMYYEFMSPEGVVVDIGCSSGAFLNSIYGCKAVKYVGVDTVVFNNETCRNYEFVNADCEEFLQNLEGADVVVSMFTLQFLGKHKRKRVVEHLKRLVSNGAVLLISEKVVMESRIESVLKRAHLQEKRKHFTDTEILEKEMALIGSMFCLDEESIMAELKEVGRASKVWQSYNFVGYVVSK